MSSDNEGFKKSCEDCDGCEDCKSFFWFRVSSCPQGPTVPQDVPEPPPVFTPVYGSLYHNLAGVPAVPGTNVDFDTVGPSSGVTLDIIDDSITVNSSGIYTITFSTSVNGSGAVGHTIDFNLSINGIPDSTKRTVYQTQGTGGVTEISMLSRTDQLMLNQGDVIRIIIAAAFSAAYESSALVVTKVA
ncbi:hypothetical protein [Lysinibacillus sp. NPDC093692]|uniref:hypothetical protein n=1 Tax=Lysinibacillus sp. NPDC093692 TaxID=3390578 RepID=UPI003CFF8FEF